MISPGNAELKSLETNKALESPVHKGCCGWKSFSLEFVYMKGGVVGYSLAFPLFGVSMSRHIIVHCITCNIGLGGPFFPSSFHFQFFQASPSVLYTYTLRRSASCSIQFLFSHIPICCRTRVPISLHRKEGSGGEWAGSEILDEQSCSAGGCYKLMYAHCSHFWRYDDGVPMDFAPPWSGVGPRKKNPPLVISVPFSRQASSKPHINLKPGQIRLCEKFPIFGAVHYFFGQAAFT